MDGEGGGCPWFPDTVYFVFSSSPLSFVNQNESFPSNEGYCVIRVNRIARRLEKCEEYVSGGSVTTGGRCGRVSM
jgi:hypothetical protein